MLVSAHHYRQYFRFVSSFHSCRDLLRWPCTASIDRWCIGRDAGKRLLWHCSTIVSGFHPYRIGGLWYENETNGNVQDVNKIKTLKTQWKAICEVVPLSSKPWVISCPITTPIPATWEVKTNTIVLALNFKSVDINIKFECSMLTSIVQRFGKILAIKKRLQNTSRKNYDK